MRKGHPLHWRRVVLDQCGCCDLAGQECIVCGWHEGRDNGLELHERHMTHVLAEERDRVREAQED